MKNKFCECQTKCKEDTENTWSCCAHMDSGRVFECPYDSLKDAKTPPCPCVDGEVPKNMPGCLTVKKEEPWKMVLECV